MSCRPLVKLSLGTAAACVFALALGCASKPTKAATPPVAPVVLPALVLSALPPEILPPVMLGIDVLEAGKFAAIAGKKVGLLTHPAGVNRRGESTISVLRRAPNAKLVALFGPEHGIYGMEKAGEKIADTVDRATGLPVYSLHGKTRKPTPAMLKGLDALVIDLQDIGSRGYTFTSCMRYAMEACFEQGVEVIVLDRPNPLGGLKVDGPPMDPEFVSYVGAFRVPYVHGLTMGELARMGKDAPNVLAVTDRVRVKGKLTVVPMRGWTRAMRWPDTGLKWIPTSPMIPDFNAVMGFAMVGLGTELGDFKSGIGLDHPFRGLNYPKKTPDQLIAEFEQYHIPGIKLVKAQGRARDGKLVTGVYVEVGDYDAWRPTELSFYLMKTACKWNLVNPFTVAPTDPASMFNKLVGSGAWWAAIRRDGRNVDVAAFINNWAARAATYQQLSKKYWLYP
ncbi:MAG TPA: DUF1343 domain-containing protein [Lacunisphaera sp.]|nr:DUF1343 domain-containing protein [Lacunisphaera sp.]